jgi:hypothetical protein
MLVVLQTQRINKQSVLRSEQAYAGHARSCGAGGIANLQQHLALWCVREAVSGKSRSLAVSCTRRTPAGNKKRGTAFGMTCDRCGPRIAKYHHANA